jgi:hypothetical protein
MVSEDLSRTAGKQVDRPGQLDEDGLLRTVAELDWNCRGAGHDIEDGRYNG